MVWMIETAEQHALGRRLDNWRGAARKLADVNRRASSLELRISWRWLVRRTASTSRNRLLAERARANQVSYAFRQAFRRKWATWADDRAQAMRMALRARTHWARSSGVRRWYDAVCRQRGETLRMRRSIADWRAWAEYSKRLSATYCVDATIGQMHTALRCWWRLHDRNRWSSLTSRNLRMLRALRQLADSADRRAAAHKRARRIALRGAPHPPSRLCRAAPSMRPAASASRPANRRRFHLRPPPQQRAVPGVWVPGDVVAPSMWRPPRARRIQRRRGSPGCHTGGGGRGARRKPRAMMAAPPQQLRSTFKGSAPLALRQRRARARPSEAPSSRERRWHCRGRVPLPIAADGLARRGAPLHVLRWMGLQRRQEPWVVQRSGHLSRTVCSSIHHSRADPSRSMRRGRRRRPPASGERSVISRGPPRRLRSGVRE